jgi:hypothetical protein
MTALFVQPQAGPSADHANRVTPLSGTRLTWGCAPVDAWWCALVDA